MGRELKRVALDFDYPIGEIWHGYLNPYHSYPCPHCKGSGYSPEAKRLSDQWYGNAAFEPAETGSRPWEWRDEPVYRLAYRNAGKSAARHEAERLAKRWNGQWGYHLDQSDVQALIDADRLWDFTKIFDGEKGWQTSQ